MAQETRCRLRAVSLELSLDENGEINGDVLEARIIELKSIAERVETAEANDLSIVTARIEKALSQNLSAICSSIEVLQSMLIAAVAGSDAELEYAVNQLAKKSTELVLKTASETNIDIVGLNQFKRRVLEERELLKSALPHEKEIEKEADELERD